MSGRAFRVEELFSKPPETGLPTSLPLGSLLQLSDERVLKVRLPSSNLQHLHHRYIVFKCILVKPNPKSIEVAIKTHTVGCSNSTVAP